MSYDVWIADKPRCTHCGSHGTTVAEFNHTSNTAAMWRLAGVDLWDYMYDREHGPASELATKLEPAIADMRSHPEKYKPLEPPNGWGSLESTIGFLEDILAACKANPDGCVGGSN